MRKICITTTAILLAFGVSTAQAQSLKVNDGPAEHPPASFTGKQYVDSKGCVFVRAGFDGAINWVPRVSRKRKVLCGFTPSIANKPAPTPATVVASAPAKPPAPRVTAPAPRVVTPAPRAVATPPRATAPRIVAAAPRVATPVQVRPAQVRVAPPVQAAPRYVPAQPVRTTTSCPGVSALSQQYMNSKHKVRCGPQGTHPTTLAVRSVAPVAAAPTGVIRVAPGPAIAPPPGYTAAFEQDRFNPNRGLQTREGFVQMRLVWSGGVPRQLVDQNTGRNVTGLFPGLRFPFINLQQQKKYVAANGWPVGSDPSQFSSSANVRAAGRNASNVRVSTKNTVPTTAVPVSVAKPKPAPVASNGHRYVQVGAFSNPINVDNSISRIRALGLPVRVGSYKKNGKTYKVVLAGPFGSASQLNAGLAKVRRDGFSGAYTRK